jgi:hypothetical protein
MTFRPRPRTRSGVNQLSFRTEPTSRDEFFEGLLDNHELTRRFAALGPGNHATKLCLKLRPLLHRTLARGVTGGHFDPEKFEDHYESALQDLLQKKQAGQPLPKLTSHTSGNVIDIMDALRTSLKDSKSPPSKATKPAPKKAAKAKPAAKRKAG